MLVVYLSNFLPKDFIVDSPKAGNMSVRDKDLFLDGFHLFYLQIFVYFLAQTQAELAYIVIVVNGGDFQIILILS